MKAALPCRNNGVVAICSSGTRGVDREQVLERRYRVEQSAPSAQNERQRLGSACLLAGRMRMIAYHTPSLKKNLTSALVR